jgi:hypothetical protein
MQGCVKCGGVMTAGTAYVLDSNGSRVPVKWVDGQPRKSLWMGLSLRGMTPRDVVARRCGKCGHIELVLDPAARDEAQRVPEIEQLKHDISKLLERIAVLELIATDPAERTAREIEALRALPPAYTEGDEPC